MLEIDGSLGEGGGQVLRSSLSLAAATGRPVRVAKVRAGRPRPGLLRQHLTALRAVAEVTGARLEGDELRSTEVVFRPDAPRSGDYGFAVGSAGSALLVLQAVLPPLLLANGPSVVRLEGGTHNPFAPPFDFVQRCFLPQLAQVGARVEIQLERHGFYPSGGGRLVLRVEPLAQARPLELLERGEPGEHRGHVLLVDLPRRIGQEERRAMIGRLRWPLEQVEIESLGRGPGPGNVVSVQLVFERVTEVVTSFGARGLPARRVGRRAAGDALRYLRHDAPVGRYLADQLMVPLALLAGGRYRTAEPTLHTKTNAEVLRTFLGPEAVVLERLADGTTRVTVRGRD